MAESNKISRSISIKNESTLTKFESTTVVDFQYLSTIKIVLLSIFTCNMYTYYLIYKWVEVLNSMEKEDEGGLTTPIVAVLLSFFTCGFGLYYFYYKIPERASYLTRKTGGNTNPKRIGIKPPIKDLPIIALSVNIGFFVYSWLSAFLTVGLLTLVTLPFIIAFYIWLHYSIQRSIEYMLCIKEPTY